MVLVRIRQNHLDRVQMDAGSMKVESHSDKALAQDRPSHTLLEIRNLRKYFFATAGIFVRRVAGVIKAVDPGHWASCRAVVQGESI